MSTRADIEKSVSKALGMGQVEGRVAVQATLEAIKRELAAGNTVKLQGFGTFEPSIRPSTTVQTPITGIPTHSERKGRVRFRPAQEVCEYVAGQRKFPKELLVTLAREIDRRRERSKRQWSRIKAALANHDN